MHMHTWLLTEVLLKLRLLSALLLLCSVLFCFILLCCCTCYDLLQVLHFSLLLCCTPALLVACSALLYRLLLCFFMSFSCQFCSAQGKGLFFLSDCLFVVLLLFSAPDTFCSAVLC